MLSSLAWIEKLLIPTVNSLLAHPGHGAIPAESPLHYAVEPIHAWWGILLLAIIAAAVVSLRHRNSQKALRPLPIKRDASRDDQ